MARKIIGFAGEIASGKTHSSRYLIEKHKAHSYRFSTPLRDILERIYVPESREALTKISLALREAFGQDILAKIVAADAKASTSELVVIDGIRRLDDISELSKLPEFIFVYIETDQKLRYERITRRGENSDDNAKTWEQFLADHLLETEVGIPSLKAHASQVIQNNGTVAELEAKLDELATTA